MLDRVRCQHLGCTDHMELNSLNTKEAALTSLCNGAVWGSVKMMGEAPFYSLYQMGKMTRDACGMPQF